jgi:hypothetical protein
VRGPAAEVEAQLKSLPHVMAVRRESGDGRRPAGANGSESPSQVFLVDGEVERDIREALAGTIVKHGWGLLEMNSVRMNLEDIFLSLTTEEEAVSR